MACVSFKFMPFIRKKSDRVSIFYKLQPGGFLNLDSVPAPADEL